MSKSEMGKKREKGNYKRKWMKDSTTKSIHKTKKNKNKNMNKNKTKKWRERKERKIGKKKKTDKK